MTLRSTPPRVFHLTLALIALGAVGCGELQDVPEGVCGNGVTEPKWHEDCDSYAPEGQSCNASCHFACDASGTPGAPTCPDGASCGLDNVCVFSNSSTCDPSSSDYRMCRATTAIYESFGQSVSAPAAQVKLGDFDGDGRQDLLTLGVANPLWLAYPRIQFFEQPSGQVTNIFDPRIPITSPSMVSLHPNDPRQQVVFSTSAGIGTFDAAANRTVLPIAYPIQQMPESTSYRMGMLKGTTHKPYGEAVILCMSTGAIAVADNQLFLAPLPGPFGSLLEPIAANVIDSADSPCDELLLAFTGDSNVYMLSPCDASGNLISEPADAVTPPASVVKLSGGRTMGRAPLVGLINPKNSNLDLLLVDDQGGVYAAFGDGSQSLDPGRFPKGTLSADPSNPEQTAGMAWPVSVEVADDCPYDTPVNGQFPLALADLDGDGYTDWVSPSGVQLTKSFTIDPLNAKVIIKACTVNAPFVGTWTVAKVADLNRDGKLDVVAGSFDEQNAAAQAPDLDFLQGTSSGLLNASAIITAGPSKYLMVGDFDGDLINDIAFTETQPSSVGGAAASKMDRLAIAFGNPSGPPSSPVEIGQVGSVEQLLSGKYEGTDSIDELGVIAEASNGSGQELSVFIGTPGRHPFAPLGLAKFLPEQDMKEISQSPLTSVVGTLSLDGQVHPGIVSVAGVCSKSSCNFGVWIVPGNDTGGFDAPIPYVGDEALPADFVPYRHDQEEVAVALALHGEDAHSKAEAYALTSGQSDGTTLLWRIGLPTTSDSWTDPPLDKMTVLADGEVGVGSNPVLVDLDDNGLLDLAVILFGPNGQQRLAVYYNEGQGPTRYYGAMDALAIANSSDSTALEHTRGFAVRPLSIRDNGELKKISSLVAVTDAGTYAIVIPPSGAAMPSIKRIENLPGGSSIDVGDVNGDGLVDFAIAVPGGVQLFTEQACKDSSCGESQVQP